ncbi:MAG: class I SAM-dependent methyltransferase [Alphaproteobacteria bacterium]|nr:class I SAM-dependent methyltransferase [Alphaproteobacteria bacterium]
MRDLCELCGESDLEPLYRPEGTSRGITVHLCAHCGLVQSLPRADRAERAPAAVSSGADWGNVRYGKGFRTQAAMAALARHGDLSRALSVLDVGSNRGSFAKALLETAHEATLVAIEPDERVAQSCGSSPRTELIRARIEDAALESGRFDVVHSCHTIEHLAHPARTLADHHRVLKDGGLLILDAPNIAILASPDIVEEWFIDKHLYHFSANTLVRMVQRAGFEIVEAPDRADSSNLLLVARKSSHHDSGVTDLSEAPRACALLAHYQATRSHNLQSLKRIAAELAQLAPTGLAIWGAGRLFDSLVVHGGFDPRCARLVIDTHLRVHVPERFGCALAGADELAAADVATVAVMSRDFASEIVREARSRAPHARILIFSELIARAEPRMAA